MTPEQKEIEQFYKGIEKYLESQNSEQALVLLLFSYLAFMEQARKEK